ncbi:MAG TPA: CocE/NonD family hydrolase [Thermoanaerobaculia bacterium]|nr:CocE/NonD family hydrolase [Thermoanaerobaculia bacterium]
MARLSRALVLLFVSLPVFAQADREKQLAEFILANYTKYERRIPMRDGVRLFTSIYVPKDASATNTYPILLYRTPYSVGPYGPDEYRKNLGPSEHFARDKYIVAYQDVRGRFMSEGQFVDMRPHDSRMSEATDTWDTIEWLTKNIAGNNGRVGMWGISYPGFYASAGMIDAHPALKAVSPQAPIANWWMGDDFHHHGTFYLPHFFNFFYTFGQPRPELTTKNPERIQHGTPDGYEWFRQLIPLSNIDEKFYKGRVAFWKDVVEHPDYDAFWQARNITQHLRGIKPAVMVVGGWFDAENLYGALATYRATEAQSPGASNMLVMGPWFHGGWARSEGDLLGDVRFHQKTSLFYRDNIELPFFEHHLKGARSPSLPEAYVFETGRNEWKRYDAWPPRNTRKRTLYLLPGGKLGWDAPAAGSEFDEYISDPAKPVPFQDAPAIRMTREYMTADQRLQGRRTDVLTYVSDVLEEDLTFAGPLQPSLFVSSTGTDADFVVKLIDVYPGSAPNPDPNPTNVQLGGYQQLVRGEPFRARWRNSFEKPEPLTPNETAKIEYTMPDVNHTFRAGHRIMIQIQSTWFPLMDINPQTFVPNIFKAKAEDFQKATHRVYHTRNAASGVGVLVLER